MRLGALVQDTLASVLRGASGVALIDFPPHSNVGDSAIWLGERIALARLGIGVVYVCDEVSYDRDALARALGGGVILIHGGGNLGNLWPNHQRFREQVIEEFPDTRIVQLPQTINFLDDWTAGQAAACFSKHEGLQIMVRDRRSQSFARETLGVEPVLCPDSAFVMGPLGVASEVSAGVLWLHRTDFEGSAGTLTLPSGFVEADWLEEDAVGAADAGRVLAGLGLPARDAFSEYDEIAMARVARGCELLSSGRVVVTDRLHGHILSLLLDIPHVVLSDRYRKTLDFVETWETAGERAVVAGAVGDAVTAARALLEKTKGTARRYAPRHA